MCLLLSGSVVLAIVSDGELNPFMFSACTVIWYVVFGISPLSTVNNSSPLLVIWVILSPDTTLVKLTM